MKNINIDEDLLRVNLQGNANEKEKADLAAWLSESAENKALFERMAKIWASTSQIDVFEQINLKQDWESIQMKRKTKTLRVNHWLRYAAVILISFGLSFLYLYDTTPGFGKLSQTKSVHQKEKVQLTDGSQIVLNTKSKLIYPNKFESDRRFVKLKGEAFFKIEPDSSKPFIIESGKAIIKVLGTSFNVRNITKNQTLVSVNTGRVSFKIKNLDQEIILTKGQAGLLQNNQLTLIDTTSLNYDSWRTGILRFRNTPIAQVIEEIEKLYKVEIKNENTNLDTLNITIDFKNYDLDKVLKHLKILTHADIEKKGQLITIK